MKLSDLNPDEYTVEESAPKSGLKLSNLNPEDVKVESGSAPASISNSPKEEDNQDADFVRGYAQGGTMGFADELGGGVQSLLDLLGGGVTDVDTKLAEQGFTGDLTPTTVDLYRKSRDNNRALDAEADARSPGAYLTGNLVGGLIPGMGATKLLGAAKNLKSLKGVPGAIGPLNKPTSLQQIQKAMEIGGASGAAIGAGMSSADLTKGEVAPLLTDSAEGLVVGAGLGGAMQGSIEGTKGIVGLLSGLRNSVGKTKPVQTFKEALSLGKEGVDLVTDTGLTSAEQGLENVGTKLGTTALGANKEAGAKLGEVRKLLNKHGVKVEIADDIDELNKTIDVLSKHSDPVKRKDAEFLRTYVDDLTLGVETPVKFTKYTPQVVKEIPAKASSKEKLAKEVERLQEQSRLSGENAKYTVVESPDKKYVSIVKTVDEQIGAPERMVPIRDANGNVIGEELNSGNAEDAWKSLLKVKTVENEAGIPSITKTIPAEIGPEQTFNIRSGGGLDKSFKQADEINKTLTDYSRVGDRSNLKSTEALNVVGRTAKNIKEKMQNPDVSSLDPKLAGTFADANSKAAATFKALETLGIDASDFSTNPITKELMMDDAAITKMMNKIRQTGSDTSTGATARKTVNKALEFLEFADPEKAKLLRPEIERSANIFDLSQKAQNLGLLNKSTYLKAGPIQAGNRLGLTLRAAKNKNPEFWTNVGTSLETMGGANARVGKIFKEIATKDDQSRNALLFSLEQQPWAREVLDSIFDKEDKKE